MAAERCKRYVLDLFQIQNTKSCLVRAYALLHARPLNGGCDGGAGSAGATCVRAIPERIPVRRPAPSRLDMPGTGTAVS